MVDYGRKYYVVGVIRFERTTSPSRTVRATKLRHTPTLKIVYVQRILLSNEVLRRMSHIMVE